MGNKSSSSTGFDDISSKVEARVGRLPLSTRYHRSPRRIEEDYEVNEKVLGSGYNGVVRMATSKGCQSGQKFAVKAFKLSNVANDKKEQLQSEVGIFLCMDHPHITRLFDVYENEDFLHLVMECCEGGELFDRVIELKRFSERDAADAVWQMLLAVNYIHSHGIVHRDLKLENFLYDSKGSKHLKLIDFGFSKIWDANIKMRISCGTLSYVAPEVLEKSYTSQCDLWSLGVITFILLAGYMPFSGAENVQTKNIAAGKYTMKPERWGTVSSDAKHFTTSLLQVDPEQRLTAPTALEHRWVKSRHQNSGEIDPGVVDALRQFGHASKFRRCCMELMAWSLSNDERAKVQQYFLIMDKDRKGTITLNELREVLQKKFHVPDDETKNIFNALDPDHHEEIHYSDFLAAMVSTRIALHDDLLKAAFKKFDADGSGLVSVDNFRQVLGDKFDGEQIDKLVAESLDVKDGKISYADFVAYIRSDPDAERAHSAAIKVIDHQLKGRARVEYSYIRGVPILLPRRWSTSSAPSSPVLSLTTTHRSTSGSPQSPGLPDIAEDFGKGPVEFIGSTQEHSTACCVIS